MLRIDTVFCMSILKLITECGEWGGKQMVHWECRRVNRERSDSEQEILDQTCSDERCHIVCMPESF